MQLIVILYTSVIMCGQKSLSEAFHTSFVLQDSLLAYNNEPHEAKAHSAKQAQTFALGHEKEN